MQDAAKEELAHRLRKVLDKWLLRDQPNRLKIEVDLNELIEVLCDAVEKMLHDWRGAATKNTRQ